MHSKYSPIAPHGGGLLGETLTLILEDLQIQRQWLYLEVGLAQCIMHSSM